MVPSGGGELAALSSAFHDMSDTLVRREQELTAANSALGHSESRFRLLAETVTDVIVLWGIDGGIRYVSPSCEAMLGYRSPEMTRLTMQDLVHPDDRAWSARRYSELLEGKRDNDEYEQRFIRRDGRTVTADGSFSLIRDTAGEPQYLLNMTKDVTGIRIDSIIE